MTDDIPDTEFAFPCADCQAGIRRLKYVTYYTWLNNELITVPNFPAWVCDACRRSEYDMRAMNWLRTLLDLPPDIQRRRKPARPNRRAGPSQRAY